jgi:membrane-associated phospholipid phosphatase
VHWNWHWLSPFGNAAVIVPLLLCATALLTLQRGEHARIARRWLMAAFAASVLVIATKIAFYGWGTGVRAWNLTSPSGHATLALVFWPAFLALLVPPQRRQWRNFAVTIGISLGLVCGLSRLMIGAHPLSEVLAGIALGGLAAALIVRGLHGSHVQLPRASTVAVLLVAFGLWTALKPLDLPSERWFKHSGVYLAGREHPMQRKDWLHATEKPARVRPAETKPQP